MEVLEVCGSNEVMRFCHKSFLILVIGQICVKPTDKHRMAISIDLGEKIEKTKYGYTRFWPDSNDMC